MKSAEELRELNRTRFIDQVCYVTEDYKRTIKYFTEMLDYGPWTIIENTNDCAFNVKLNDKPVEEPWKFYIAFTKVGNMTIEVIQPELGQDPYSQFLKEKGPGIHHIKESIYSGDDNLRKYMDYLVEKGHPMTYEGEYMEDIYYYIDTHKDTGAYYEVGNSAVCSGHPRLVGYYPEV